MRRGDFGFIVVLGAIWGAVYPLTAVALRQVGPTEVVFARTAAAAVILVPFAFRARVLRAVIARWPDVLAAAALQATIPLVLLTIGQQHVSASVAGILSGAQPVAVALLAFAIPGARRPGWQLITGIAVGLAGIVLLFSGRLGASGTSLPGGLAVLGSAFFFALGAVWIDARLADIPPLAVASTAMCVSAIALLPFAVSSVALTSPETAAELIVLGAVGTGAALVLFYALIQRASAARAAPGRSSVMYSQRHSATRDLMVSRLDYLGRFADGPLPDVIVGIRERSLSGMQARGYRGPALYGDRGRPALIEVPDREDAVLVAGLAESVLDFLEELGQPGGHDGRHRLPQRVECQRGHGNQRLVTRDMLSCHPWRLLSSQPKNNRAGTARPREAIARGRLGSSARPGCGDRAGRGILRGVTRLDGPAIARSAPTWLLCCRLASGASGWFAVESSLVSSSPRYARPERPRSGCWHGGRLPGPASGRGLPRPRCGRGRAAGARARIGG